MYAKVALMAGPKPGATSIPREALIRTGQGERVIMALGDGRFAPRTVDTGIESGNRIEILDGLRPGEKVVTSAQFLLDSEASLKASLLRMGGAEPGPADSPKSGPAAAVEGVGRITSVDRERHRLTLAHAPIAALDWPAMTMEFAVEEGVPLDGLRPGMQVRFSLRPQGDAYAITDIASGGQ